MRDAIADGIAFMVFLIGWYMLFVVLAYKG